MVVEYQVPKLWPGETVVCFASGPSLTREDVEYCRGKARTIAVNDTFKFAPWADVLYACDERWWRWNWKKGAETFPGLKFAITHGSRRYPGVKVLRNTGIDGLEHRPTGLRNGRNSGYQAINLAVHLGVSKVILLGYDMQRGPKGEEHFFGDHPNKSKSPFDKFVKRFESLVGPLSKVGVEVVNCTRETALTMFPREALERVL